MEKIIVIDSPFKELPNGTEVVKVKAPIKTMVGRKGKKIYTDDWYKTANGNIILDRIDGKVRLFNNEIQVQ